MLTNLKKYLFAAMDSFPFEWNMHCLLGSANDFFPRKWNIIFLLLCKRQCTCTPVEDEE